MGAKSSAPTNLRVAELLRQAGRVAPTGWPSSPKLADSSFLLSATGFLSHLIGLDKPEARSTIGQQVV